MVMAKMQTFLPYPDFDQSARSLDNRRLGKQRVEALTILNILEGRTSGKGWRNHPAVLMWRGCEEALKLYLNACLAEWKRRGFKNNIKSKRVKKEIVWPWWLGREEFHSSHRANLLRKYPEFYSKFGWTDETATPYWWPTKEAGD